MSRRQYLRKVQFTGHAIDVDEIEADFLRAIREPWRVIRCTGGTSRLRRGAWLRRFIRSSVRRPVPPAAGEQRYQQQDRGCPTGQVVHNRHGPVHGRAGAGTGRDDFPSRQATSLAASRGRSGGSTRTAKRRRRRARAERQRGGSEFSAAVKPAGGGTARDDSRTSSGEPQNGRRALNDQVVVVHSNRLGLLERRAEPGVERVVPAEYSRARERRHGERRSRERVRTSARVAVRLTVRRLSSPKVTL